MQLEALRRPSPIGRGEFLAVNRVLKHGILSRAGRGNFVARFERDFAKHFGTQYAIATTSGTTALHAAISALGLSRNDEVLVPTLTFISTASVVLQQSAKVVFVDIDPATFCVRSDDLERNITPRTKALMIVHLYGNCADVRPIMKIARKHNLAVIEDCAQAAGSRYNGTFAGTFGDMACFSFYQTKNLTCGEGGIVITDNADLHGICRSITDHGLVDGNLQGYDYDRIGHNYHLSELHAAIGIVQLKQLQRLNRLRQTNAELYIHYLRDTELTFQQTTLKSDNVYYALTALLPQRFAAHRDWFVKAVRAENVEVNRMYPLPLHKTRLFQRLQSGVKCPVAEDVTSRLFNFYTNPGISAQSIRRTAEAVLKVMEHMPVRG